MKMNMEILTIDFFTLKCLSTRKNTMDRIMIIGMPA